ncbi:MAG: hypothetical protein KDB22_06625 [Planctomycetales bacterium]|nr:hypothetical protein [Planctomycetales bacterium]
MKSKVVFTAARLDRPIENSDLSNRRQLAWQHNRIRLMPRERRNIVSRNIA